MTPFHNVVDPSGYTIEASILTFSLSGTVAASDVGKAVSADPGQANTMRLAGDGDVIRGYLVTLENRSFSSGGPLGAIASRFVQKFAIKAGDPVAVGDSVVGGGAGTVKKAPANSADNVVTAVSGGFATVSRL
jgi:hypothetical protein